MMSMIKITLKQKRLAIVAYSLGGVAMIWLYVAIYPSMAAQVDIYNQMIKSMPAALMKAFGADNIGLTNFEGLIGIKMYGMIWPLMLLFLMVSLAGSTITAEIEQTTIGLWLSQPISRAKIYWSKYLAGIAILTIFIVFTVLAVWPITALYHISISTHDIWNLALIGGLFGLAVYGLTLFLASIFSEKSKVYGLVAGILAISYVLNLVASLNDKLANLKYVSLFYYYNVNDLLTGRPITISSLVIFVGVGVVGALAGRLIFSRRDIAI